MRSAEPAVCPLVAPNERSKRLNSHAQVLGARPAPVSLGKLYRRTGKREQAQEHLTTAIARYREMDVRFWLEQAEAELRKLEEGSP